MTSAELRSWNSQTAFNQSPDPAETETLREERARITFGN